MTIWSPADWSSWWSQLLRFHVEVTCQDEHPFAVVGEVNRHVELMVVRACEADRVVEVDRADDDVETSDAEVLPGQVVFG